VKTHDPVDQFNEYFDKAKASGDEQSEAMALATVNRFGHPRIRTVLLKDQVGRGFRFFTNYNSRKAQEMRDQPRASALFFWRSLYVQIRLDGAISQLSGQQSDDYWQTRPRESQVGAWVSQQSSVLSSFSDLEQEFDRGLQEYKSIKSVPRPEFWGGYELLADRIEIWVGRGHRLHHRYDYFWYEEKWNLQLLYP
jgi:pyridoxamine 5'-phosphate oxidase